MNESFERTPFSTGKQLLTAIALCILLAACGQRGPLFLPEEAPEAATSEQTEEEAKEENDEETS